MKDLFFWAVLYQLVYGICGALQSGWVTAVGLALFLTLLVLWCLRTGKAKRLGLTGCAMPKGWELCVSLLLLLPALINLLAGGFTPVPPATAGILLCAALTEEILFRGFALQALGKGNALRGVLCSAALFALLHGSNLFRDALPDVLLQMLFAFFAGICYAGVTLRMGSLLPCALAHVLTNLTGYSLSAEIARPLYVLGSAIFALGGIPYIIATRRKQHGI